jgi:hypothetical protein
MRTILFSFVFGSAIACGEALQKNTPATAPNEALAQETLAADTQPTAIAISQKEEVEAPLPPPSPDLAPGKPAPAPKGNSSTKKAAPAAKPAPAQPEQVLPAKPAPVLQIEEATAPPTAPVMERPAEVAAPQPPSHEPWDKLLGQHVGTDGKVNYKGLKNDKAKLDAYLLALQNNPPQDGWTRNETMAFWINAYNAFTVKMILDNYPLTSIMKLDGGKPWDKKWIKLGSKTYSLNNIENDILRPHYREARIHFAVNCAAKSCPPLLNKAWTADNLESNFDKQARAFVNNPKFNTISANRVKVSKIFEWYAADFGNLIEFLNKFSTTRISPNAKVEYVEYDWGLNE